jgi:K+-transporting ATPase ATPase C chain
MRQTNTEFETSHSSEARAEGAGSPWGHLRATLATTLILGVICCGIYPIVVWAIAQVVFPTKANGSLVRKDGTYTTNDQEAVGSALLGQNFSASGYFHPRPSAAGSGYDASSSGGTNLGPLSAKLINGTTKPTTLPATQPGADPLPGPDAMDFDGARDRIVHYCVDNNITYTSSVPLKDFQDAQGNLDDVKLIKAFNSDNPPVFTPSIPIPGDAVTASGSGLDPHISIANAELQKGRVAQARNISPDQVQALIDAHTDKPDLGVLGDPGVNVLLLNIALDSKYPLPPPPTTAPTTAPASTPTSAPTTAPTTGP